MTRLIQHKTSFTAGEISRDLLGRGDLRAYENGALALRNLFIHPTGGVTRRAGTAYVDTLAGTARLIAYEYNTGEIFLLALTNTQLDVYQDDVLIHTMAAPWTSAQLDQIAWTQSADTLLVTHPDVLPKKITRSSIGNWTISDWSYATDTAGDVSYQPYYKFADPAVTLTASATTGSVTITASSASFAAGMVGSRLRIKGRECTITAYTNPVTVTATVHGSLSATTATKDWAENVFSSYRGYPIAAAFHQDRLVVGGSKSLPNRLWFSKSGDLYNFDLGTGLDDEAIEFGILSDQVNAIRAVFSGRHLQVFTSGAEWMVTGDPLTPANLQLKRQTRVGSMVERMIPPVDVDGATLFVARSGSEIREFLYTDLEQAYQATDLALLSRHIIATPIDQDFDKKRRLLFIVRDDGKLATLTMFRAEQVAAWTLHETDGAFKQATAVGDQIYVLVLRGSDYQLERLDDALNLDSAVVDSAGSPATVWAGLDHLNGKTVKVVGDGVPQADRVVSSGSVTIATAATSVQIGLPFTHHITPLPVNMVALPGTAHALRLVRLRLRLEATQALDLDVGKGTRAMALPGNGPPDAFSGDLVVHGYGWTRDFDAPLWGIESDVPLPCTILSVSTELKVN